MALNFSSFLPPGARAQRTRKNARTAISRIFIPFVRRAKSPTKEGYSSLAQALAEAATATTDDDGDDDDDDDDGDDAGDDADDG